MENALDEERPPGKRARAWLALLVLLPMGAMILTGWLGVDFGEHWDQQHRVRDLTHALQENTLLPDDYNYPSVTFWLTLLAAAPEVAEVVDLDPETEEFRGELTAYLRSDAFQFAARRLFLVVTSLTSLWVFGALLAWRRRVLEGLVAAALVAGSFEIAYHARWVAPDAILMQFCAMSALGCVCALRTRRTSAWLTLAAVAAGLAAGTKYTGGACLLPVVVVALGEPRRVAALARVTTVFALTFLVTTPGALLEPTRFLTHVLYEIQHYQEGHVGFTVEAGGEHLFKMLRYLLLAGPSPWALASVPLCLLGLLGAVGLWRDSRRLALVILVLPLLFVPYLASQKVMFVRNLLLVMPFAAILSARGAGLVWDLCRARPARLALAAGLTAIVGANIGFTYYAARTIGNDTTERLARAVEGYIEGRPELVFQLSPRVDALLQEHGAQPGAHVRREPDETADVIALFPLEIRTQGYWPSNDPDLKDTLGPLSVNYDYYATWWSRHVIMIERSDLLELATEFPLPGVEKIVPALRAQPRRK